MKVLLFLLIGGVALASDAQISGVGTPYFVKTEALSATGCITQDASSSLCLLIPAGEVWSHQNTVAVVTADAAGECCYSYIPGAAVTSGPLIAVGSATHECAGFVIDAAGVEVHTKPNRIQMNDYSVPTSSTTTGLCSTAITSGGESLYLPCSADAICTTYSAGTCTASPTTTQRASAGLFLNCLPGSGTVNFTVRKERVQR